ncbi:MAG: CFI-box-CTERM domain-containing protein [Candidatus Hodarchaeota archaeon]
MGSILAVSLFLLALFPAHLSASSLTLAWDPNTEPDLAGYKVYYGTRSGDYDDAIDVGDVIQYTVWGLEPETRYYLALTAYDTSWNESDFSWEVSGITGDDPPPPVQTDSEDGHSEWGCFIATAAYGSYLNSHVKNLRDFRDKFLISNSLGRKFVRLYYQYGPRIANHIEKYDFLQLLSRQALLPLIGISSLFNKSNNITPFPTLLFQHSFSPFSFFPSSSPLHSPSTSARIGNPFPPSFPTVYPTQKAIP